MLLLNNVTIVPPITKPEWMDHLNQLEAFIDIEHLPRAPRPLFHRLGTIPVDSGVGVTSSPICAVWERDYGHSTNSWKFARIRPYTMHNFFTIVIV